MQARSVRAVSVIVTGSSKAAILAILLLFVAGAAVLSRVDEAEGMRAVLERAAAGREERLVVERVLGGVVERCIQSVPEASDAFEQMPAVRLQHQKVPARLEHGGNVGQRGLEVDHGEAHAGELGRRVTGARGHVVQGRGSV